MKNSSKPVQEQPGGNSNQPGKGIIPDKKSAPDTNLGDTAPLKVSRPQAPAPFGGSLHQQGSPAKQGDASGATRVVNSWGAPDPSPASRMAETPVRPRRVLCPGQGRRLPGPQPEPAPRPVSGATRRDSAPPASGRAVVPARPKPSTNQPVNLRPAAPRPGLGARPGLFSEIELRWLASSYPGWFVRDVDCFLPVL